MDADGIHWATQFELVRRGGITSKKRIEPSDVEGYIQALRTQHTTEMKKMIDESKNSAGRTSRMRRTQANPPPGLERLPNEIRKDSLADTRNLLRTKSSVIDGGVQRNGLTLEEKARKEPVDKSGNKDLAKDHLRQKKGELLTMQSDYYIHHPCVPLGAPTTFQQACVRLPTHQCAEPPFEREKVHSAPSRPEGSPCETVVEESLDQEEWVLNDEREREKGFSSGR